MFLLACHMPAACFTHAHSLRQSPAWPLPTQLRNLCSTANLLCDPEEVPPLSGLCCSLLSEWFIREQRALLPSAVCCSRQLLLRDKLSQSLAADTPVIWLLTVLQRGLGLLGSLAGLSQRPPSGTLGVRWGCPVRGGLAHTSEHRLVLSAAGAPVLLCPASPAGPPRLLWGTGCQEGSPSVPVLIQRLLASPCGCPIGQGQLHAILCPWRTDPDRWEAPEGLSSPYSCSS